MPDEAVNMQAEAKAAKPSLPPILCSKPSPKDIHQRCAFPSGHVGKCCYRNPGEWRDAMQREARKISAVLDAQPKPVIPRHIIRDCPNPSGDMALSRVRTALNHSFSAESAADEDAPKPMFQPGDEWTIHIRDHHHYILINGSLTREGAIIAHLRHVLKMGEICECQKT